MHVSIGGPGGADRQQFSFGQTKRCSVRFSVEGKSVLVVDDTDIQRHAVVEQLANWNMNVREADSTTVAMMMLNEAYKAKTPFDLVIVDWTLRGGNADALLTQINKMADAMVTPILLLAPLDGEHFHHSDIAESAMLKMLDKPISCSPLYDAILLLLQPEEAEMSGIIVRGNAERRSVGVLPGGRKVRILVADDNKVNQIVVNAILGEVGLTCDVVQNGQEAYDRFLEGKHDLILMDCQMPLMDGYESTKMIRKWEENNKKPRIPIIALTANAVTGDIQKCLDVGMDAYCSKPVNPIRLFETIDRVLDVKK